MHVLAYKKQTGTVLLVVVVLLLLTSILGLMALNSGVFEQRASRNDLRAKLVRGAAEAGVAQAMEYLHQNASLLTTSANWKLCDADDESFPCGTAPASRRATMWRWSGTGHDFNGDGSITGWEQKMLPIPAANLITTVGNGFKVNYGVGAVACRIASKTAASDPTVCTDFSDPAVSTTSAITLVSVAELVNEGTRTTVIQSIGSYNLLGDLTNAPPILSAGNVNITGGLQVVTNPNSGGVGVPVSVWTRKSVDKTGTPNTCYYNEYLHSSTGAANGTIYLDDASPNFPLCDNCGCAGSDSLSFNNSGNKVAAGIDILQNSGVNSDYSKPLASGYANYDVKPEEFPCDTFAQLFKVSAWKDDDGDKFCETKIPASFKNPNDGSTVTMGADEAYLFENAKTIVNPTASGQLLSTAAQLDKPAAYPSSAYSGLVWCQSSCDIGSNAQLGTPAKPVLLVIDSSSGVAIQGKVFGLVFLRSMAKTNGSYSTLTPPTGYTMSSSEVNAGGSAGLSMNSKAIVYGAIIVQGQVTKANGSAAVVYNGDVLSGLMKENDFTKFVALPGGWTDRVSY